MDCAGGGRCNPSVSSGRLSVAKGGFRPALQPERHKLGGERLALVVDNRHVAAAVVHA